MIKYNSLLSLLLLKTALDILDITLSLKGRKTVKSQNYKEFHKLSLLACVLIPDLKK